MTTFYEFMENSLNVKQTADTLFVHKNTLIYRIEKIKSILGYDFSDSWENFTLYLSLRIVMFNGLFQPPWRKEKEEEHQKRLR